MAVDFHMPIDVDYYLANTGSALEKDGMTYIGMTEEFVEKARNVTQKYGAHSPTRIKPAEGQFSAVQGLRYDPQSSIKPPKDWMWSGEDEYKKLDEYIPHDPAIRDEVTFALPTFEAAFGHDLERVGRLGDKIVVAVSQRMPEIERPAVLAEQATPVTADQVTGMMEGLTDEEMKNFDLDLLTFTPGALNTSGQIFNGRHTENRFPMGTISFYHVQQPLRKPLKETFNTPPAAAKAAIGVSAQEQKPPHTIRERLAELAGKLGLQL